MKKVISYSALILVLFIGTPSLSHAASPAKIQTQLYNLITTGKKDAALAYYEKNSSKLSPKQKIAAGKRFTKKFGGTFDISASLTEGDPAPPMSNLAERIKKKIEGGNQAAAQTLFDRNTGVLTTKEKLDLLGAFNARFGSGTSFFDTLRVYDPVAPGTGGSGTVVTPPGSGTVVTPPGSGTVVTPPGSGTVVTPPGSGTVVTPPGSGTVVTPPGTSTTPAAPVGTAPTGIHMQKLIDNLKKSESNYKKVKFIPDETKVIYDQVKMNMSFGKTNAKTMRNNTLTILTNYASGTECDSIKTALGSTTDDVYAIDPTNAAFEAANIQLCINSLTGSPTEKGARQEALRKSIEYLVKVNTVNANLEAITAEQKRVKDAHDIKGKIKTANDLLAAAITTISAEALHLEGDLLVTPATALTQIKALDSAQAITIFPAVEEVKNEVAVYKTDASTAQAVIIGPALTTIFIQLGVTDPGTYKAEINAALATTASDIDDIQKVAMGITSGIATGGDPVAAKANEQSKGIKPLTLPAPVAFAQTSIDHNPFAVTEFLETKEQLNSAKNESFKCVAGFLRRNYDSAPRVDFSLYPYITLNLPQENSLGGYDIVIWTPGVTLPTSIYLDPKLSSMDIAPVLRIIKDNIDPSVGTVSVTHSHPGPTGPIVTTDTYKQNTMLYTFYEGTTKVGIKPDKKTMGSIDYLYNKLLLKIK
jgi:hypothetical protein